MLCGWAAVYSHSTYQIRHLLAIHCCCCVCHPTTCSLSFYGDHHSSNYDDDINHSPHPVNLVCIKLLALLVYSAVVLLYCTGSNTENVADLKFESNKPESESKSTTTVPLPCPMSCNLSLIYLYWYISVLSAIYADTSLSSSSHLYMWRSWPGGASN